MDRMLRQILPFASLLVLVLVLSVAEPEKFATWSNILNVLRRSSVNGIVAAGMTLVIISAGIDLSVGSMLALCGMAGSFLILEMGGGPVAMLAGTAAGLLLGAFCGYVNGTVTTKLCLPPFIVTLGAMSVFRGISYVMNDGQPYNVQEYRYLGEGDVLGVPVSVVIFIGVILVTWFILRYTRLGRYTYAVGSNREAAFHAGINVDRVLICVYSLTGFFTGLAAMIQTSRTVSAQPTAAQGLELDIIAAVVIGGASLSGGRGGIIGTVVGTLLISFLRNGCTLMGISTNVQLVVIGVIIVAAVAVDRIAQSRMERSAAA